MPNIKKKIVVTVIALSTSLLMAGPAFGATAEELQAQIDALMAQLATLQAQLAELEGAAPAVTGCTITSFDRNLKVGMTGDDVKCLQIVLNSDADTQLATEGVGSPGNETSYFGPLTEAAVVKFQEKYADEVLASWGLTSGTGFVGSTTRAKLDSLLAAPAEEVPAEEVPAEEVPAEEAVELAPGLTVTVEDTPAAGTIVSGSGMAELARFTFANGDADPVKVTKVKLKRTGISDDTTLPALYLFEGYKRLADEATLSSGYATFNVASGIFSVPAGESKTISVRADVKDSVSGQTVRVGIEAAADITNDATAVNGTFPLSGSLMSVAAASTKATVTLGSATPAQAEIDATDDFVAWSNTLSVTNQDVSLEYVRFTQIGSIAAGSLDNIRLVLGGTEIATSSLVAGTVGQDLIFDLSASPVSITKGQTKTVQVYVDIVSGASKTMRFGLEKTADIFLKDAAFSHYVLVSGTVPSRAGTQTINTGTVTVTKASDSASGNVVNAASNVVLAKFNVKANGEEVKINSLRVEVITNDTDVKYLRNVSLLLDGTQVGNTSTVATNYATTTYTDFNIYQKIGAGVTSVLEVKGDVYGCAGTSCTANVLTATKTIQVRIVGSEALDNAQGMSSLSMIDAPGANANANTLTVGEGSLTLKAHPAYGNQSVAAGSDTRIGSYTLTSAAYDTINISAFTVGITLSGMSLTDLSNIYLVYDSTETSKKGTVTASNMFSVTTSLAPSSTMTINVWATISTDAQANETVITDLAVTATKATDGTDASASSVSGQTITIKAGTLTTALASDSPVSAIVTGLSTGVSMAKFTFSALYEAFTVSEVKIETVTSSLNDNFVSLYLKYKDADGAEVTSSALPLVNGVADFTGMTMYIASGGNTDLTVYGNLNAVAASGYADTGDQPQLKLTYYKAGSGSQPIWEGKSGGDEDIGTGRTANAMLLYKTKPTVEVRAGIKTGTLVNGTNDLYAATIAADTAGDVGLKKIVFNVNGTGVTTDAANLKFYRGGTDITSLVNVSPSSGNITTGSDVTVEVVFSSEEVITAGSSWTYYLRITGVTGAGTGDNIQTYIKADEAYKAPTTYSGQATTNAQNFVWTDKTYPASLHSVSSADWDNGYLVKTLGSTETYTLSY